MNKNSLSLRIVSTALIVMCLFALIKNAQIFFLNLVGLPTLLTTGVVFDSFTIKMLPLLIKQACFFLVYVLNCFLLNYAIKLLGATRKAYDRTVLILKVILILTILESILTATILYSLLFTLGGLTFFFSSIVIPIIAYGLAYYFLMNDEIVNELT